MNMCLQGEFSHLIQKKFCDSNLFTFADVFNYLREITCPEKLTIALINDTLNDLTYLGLFRKIIDEVGCNYYSSIQSYQRRFRSFELISKFA
jgi:hypothetical protein